MYVLKEGTCEMLTPLQTNNRKMADFLCKDFEGEEARRAAAKNAFALLGQHKWGEPRLD